MVLKPMCAFVKLAAAEHTEQLTLRHLPMGLVAAFCGQVELAAKHPALLHQQLLLEG